ncbi:MAG: DUF4160 domain-containing protein [bacterium]
MSPTVLRSGPYRFFFFSNELGEPAHVHVQRERMLAKFWLRPLRLARSTGFSPRELRRIEGIVAENLTAIQEAWDEYFSA